MSFKNTKECYQALIEGHTLQDTYKNTVCLDNGGNQCVKNIERKLCKGTAFNFDNPSDWIIYEEMISISVNEFKNLFKEKMKGHDSDDAYLCHIVISGLRTNGYIQ
jgi:hypothetical protein